MEIQCKCGSWDTHPVRDAKTSHETGYFRCLSCKCKFVPRDAKPTSTVDLTERLEVLDAQRKQLNGRLLAVSRPQEMIDYAVHLECEAEKLFDKAQCVRRALQDDIASVGELLQELQNVELEIAACHYCQAAKLKMTKGELRDVVNQYLERERMKSD